MIVMRKKDEQACVCPNPKQLLHRGLAESAPGHDRNLVAFLRFTEGGPTVEEQAALIGGFCEEHGNRIVLTIIDSGHTDFLENIIASLENASGLIVTDLDRLVVHRSERARELRPLLHEFMCQGVHKRLVSIREGIDTSMPAGQHSALEVINQLKDADATALKQNWWLLSSKDPN